ncbi:hypothetical protein CEXT_149291 [Caerostris extrusa]|uniref:Uncharacterized protein n=1 Tax=Caerostris extrusa TaxID=172846 RepID=A0AAV4Y2M9_CAEEX|nr:hypothetical protein CEXT_149291 [Caerostris extrusa]
MQKVFPEAIVIRNHPHGRRLWEAGLFKSPKKAFESKKFHYVHLVKTRKFSVSGEFLIGNNTFQKTVSDMWFLRRRNTCKVFPVPLGLMAE